MPKVHQSDIRNSCFRDEDARISIRTWLLSLYLFFAPLDFLPVIPGVSMSRFLIALPLAGALITVRQLKMRTDRFLIIPILYVMIIVVTGYYSFDIKMTFERIFAVGTNVAVILILAMFHYSEKEIYIIKKVMALSGWLVLLLMAFYSDSSLLNGRVIVIINGVFQDPNYLTGFLIFPVIYYLDEFLKSKKIFSLVKLGILFTLILLTGSRGGLIAILGAITFYCMVWFKANRFKLSAICIFLGFISALGALIYYAMNFLPESVAERYALAYTLEDGAAGRSSIWRTLLYNFEQMTGFHKMFGWGAGTITHFTFNGNVAHNVWLEAMVEIGIFGLLILIAFYFVFFIKAVQIKEYAVSAVFVGYMIMTMSLSLYSYKPIWNIILLILILKNNVLVKLRQEPKQTIFKKRFRKWGGQQYAEN